MPRPNPRRTNQCTLKPEEPRKFLTFHDQDGSEIGSFAFPTRRVVPIDHQFSADDPAEKMVQDFTLDAIEQLKLPRYDLTAYLTPDAHYHANAEDKKFIEDFTSARGQVAGFVRTNFYKRLSSCGHSFILSLRRHLLRNELFMYAYENGLDLPAGTLDPATLADDSIDLDSVISSADINTHDVSGIAIAYERLQKEAPKGIRWVKPKLFRNDLLEDLQADSESIIGLLDEYGPWDITQDSKLGLLADMVQSKHGNEKVLIFTEYKDTAKYLENGLRQLGVDSVFAATGETEDATTLARRFSPKTNETDDPDDKIFPEDEIRVLIATDVLSEGQNLQQAHIIANYDLPWAIIKLIQRAGRVDRIGQESDEVLLYTMVHGDVENQLNLRRRIQQRLAANAATFGSDEKFFGTDSETQTISDLYDGKIDDDIAVGEDVDAGSLAYELWQAATEDDEALRRRIENLPDLIDATRPQYPGDDEGVLCCAATDSGIDSFAWQSVDGESRLLAGHEALAIVKCQPETPALPMREGHDEIVTTLIRDVITTNLNTSGRLRGERKILFNRLNGTIEAGATPRFSDAMDAMYKSPLTALATNQLRKLRRKSGVTDNELLALIADLHEQGMLTTTATKSAEAIRIVASMGVTK
ncbi:C-terminal helicase domain-containing protein [Corynebacterium phoceense]